MIYSLLQMRFPMNRRQFSKMFSLGVLGSWWLAIKGLGQEQSNQPAIFSGDSSFFESYGELPTDAGRVNHTIRYVRDHVPEFHIPPYSGERYEDTVPDTDRKSTRLNSSHLGISYAVF